MKKKMLLVFVLFAMFALVGCGKDSSEVISVNVGNNENLSNSTFGRSAMVEIGDGLWYDKSTLIVYWWGGYLSTPDETFGRSFETSPSPYYAPNGLPYRYNPATNTFEEIDGCSECER